MNIEDKIRLFTELPGDERRKVERYVEEQGDEQPHLKKLLRESRRLGQLFEQARRLGAEPPDREAVAFYAVMREVDRGRMPQDLSESLDRLESRIAADPDLHQQLQRYEERGAELARASDAEAQFARLTGEEPRPIEGGETDRRPAARHADSGRDRSPAVRHAATSTSRNLRHAAVATLAAAALYALLFVGSRWMQPAHERLARFGSEELQLSGYSEVRGGDVAPADAPTAIYIEALDYLRESESSFIGLFPGFRQAPLDSAAAHLQEVVALEPDDSFLAEEARYFLAKTELARGNVAEARSTLERVAQSPGMRAEDARSLLQEMERLN